MASRMFLGKIRLETLSSKSVSLQTKFRRKKRRLYKKLRQERKKLTAESSDWRRAYDVCPSNRAAGQMRNPLGYRGTP